MFFSDSRFLRLFWYFCSETRIDCTEDRLLSIDRVEVTSDRSSIL